MNFGIQISTIIMISYCVCLKVCSEGVLRVCCEGVLRVCWGCVEGVLGACWGCVGGVVGGVLGEGLWVWVCRERG